MAKSLIFFIIFQSILWASVSDVNIKILKNKLKTQSSKIAQIIESISQIEIDLNKNNDQVIDILNKRKSIEEKIYQIKQRNEQLKSKNTKIITGLDKTLKILALKKINDSQKLEDQMIIKVLENGLKMSSKKIESIQLEINDSKKDLDNLNKIVLEYAQAEKSINETIFKLENEKKDLASNYIDSKKKKADLSSRLFDLKKKFIYKTIQKNNFEETLLKYLSPIKGALSIEYKDKGVTYNIEHNKNIYALGDGTIIHTGPLGSYGNVIMIDHQKSIQSVILGDLKISVKKGQNVRAGQLIGRTLVPSGKIGKVYVDLREKNNVLDTYPLLDKNTFKVKQSERI